LCAKVVHNHFFGKSVQLGYVLKHSCRFITFSFGVSSSSNNKNAGYKIAAGIFYPQVRQD